MISARFQILEQVLCLQGRALAPQMYWRNVEVQEYGMYCRNHAQIHKVGDHVVVKLSGGRIVEATIKAVIETTEGVRLQMSFEEETALI
jgi:hypothetical protein